MKVTLDRRKCIGNKACLAQDPKHFEVVENKALLRGVSESDVQVLEFTGTSDDLVAAAEVCPVNAITISDNDEEVVGSTVKRTDDFERITAEYDDEKEFVLDPKGYFLIKIEPETETIHVGFCTMKNKLQYEVIGKKPIDIYQTVIRKKIIDRLDHAAYLGRELQKAFIALQKGSKYVQDDELE